MDHQRARDLFEETRDAVEACDRLDARRERLDAMDLSPTRPKAGTGGGDQDARRLTDIRLELEAQVAGAYAERDALLNITARILRGEDGAGGVASLLGQDAADVLDLRYRRAAKWDVVAAYIGRSRRHCYRLRDVAFELTDYLGVERTIAGEARAVV